jgi:hypothetical protein
MGGVHDRANWIAFVSEELGEDEAGLIATARFSVMVERQSGDDPTVEIADESMALDDALVWARERATRVLVRRGGFGDHAYTAGDVPVEDRPPLSEALPVKRRRLPGWEFVDRTMADPPISWDVVVEAYQPGLRPGATWQPFDHRVGEQWAASLAAALIEVVELRSDWEMVRPFERGWTQPAEFAAAVLRVQGRTVEEARSVADGLVRDAIRTATTPTPWSLRAAGAYPTGSAPARANARVG